MDDPALSRFLALLARDISAHPERLLAVDANLRQRAQSLVEGIAVDLDAPL
ncbi:type II toxin-antitoxin system PrlF family antitoxin [Pseudomonas nitroreducens]|nr:type II toxin-antitoxin system PrlF family antitoxin [Pseudomonas nitritireducens]MCE4081312.1 type II toxin-antitoxin system PrlF family antitoxin [Pseudomonas nitroreducens]